MAERREFFVWLGAAELADAVITTRKAIGITQAELAQRAGVGMKFVYQLEHGKATLRADKVLGVLRALGLMPLLLPAAVGMPG